MQASDHDFQATIPVRLPYRVFLPDRYNPSGNTDYPLIIFLHGAGARGEDLAQVEELGLANKLARGYSLPFIVVAPQCPRNLDWSTILPALDALVLHILQTFRVDPDRVYLTGLSMGGFGVWALATAYPYHFAAVAPVCGGGRRQLDFPDRLRNIVHLPVWCFHGDQDAEIPVEESLRMVGALKDYGGDVRCSIYSGLEHQTFN
jgi:predicted peptidase